MKKYIAILFAAFLLGFFVGRSTLNKKTEVEYIELPAVSETITHLKAVRVDIPERLQLPTTPKIYALKGGVEISVQEVDTAAIIAEYILSKNYSETLFDNKELGKLSIDATVQYNSLQKLTYNYTPIQKNITTVKTKRFTPFLTTSYNTLNFVGVGGGFFYNDLGASLKYITDFDVKGVEIGAYVKF